jgi:ribosome-binding protein aMBF1 (putative translation factor)
MVGIEQIKAAKLLGKRLRKAREEQGFNLAILASKLKFTVVEIVAIEDGNLYAFDNSLDTFSESADRYAKEVGADISSKSVPKKEEESVTEKDCDESIPHFLRKQ